MGEQLMPSNVSRVKAQELVKKGWQVTYATLFGQSFVDVLAPHHEDSISWHWNARIDLLEGRQPLFYADFPMWSRGHMKSTVARRVAVVDAFLSYAYNQGGYCLYFSGTDDKTSKHAISINQLLQSKPMQIYAPGLAKVKRAEEGSRSLGWKATFYYTEAGYVFHFGSLQSGLAGGNVDDLRPTLMIPDDIDDRKDSIAIAERNLKAFTLEILPMGKTGTLTFFAQNLISRFSLMYRIYTNKLKVLTNRRPSKPIPAVQGLEIEYRTINGISKPFIVKGEATWDKGMPIDSCQEELQRMGEESFLSECQHEVEQSRTGLVHRIYDDSVHPISYSQFAAVYGSQDAWKSFYKVPFSDWARTKTKFHTNIAGYLVVSSQNTKLPGFTFCIPLSFPADSSPADVAERLLTTLTPIAYQNRTWKDLIAEAWKRLNAGHHFQTEMERLEYLKSYYSSLIPQYSRPVLEKFNVRAGANSHSEDKVRDIFNIGFGFAFMPSNPAKADGLEDIDEAMRVDYNEPHCFDPTKNGYSRWAVLCPDDKSQKPTVINGIEVYPPHPYPESLEGDELHDSELFRFQMCNRRFAPPKLTETGEKIDELLKLNDDFGQGLQMVYFKRLLSNLELTTTEIVKKRYNEITLFANNEDLSVGAQISRQIAQLEAVRQLKKEGLDVDWDGQETEPNEFADLSGGW